MRKILAGAAVVAAAALVLTGCSSGGSSGGKETVTVRVWDDQVAKSYKTSFAEFEKKNKNITVKVDVVPYSNYFTTLRTDVAGNKAPDIFWVNNSYYQPYADGGKLMNIDDALGSDAKKKWDEKTVKQFTSKGKLWGVPQLTDAGIGMYYNEDALKSAGLSANDLKNLKWSTNESEDTLLPVLKKLTKDSAGRNATDPNFDANNIAQYGFNASDDLQAILLPFIGSAGGTYQDGEKFTYSNEKTQQAFQYIVDLINKYHVAPPASDTNSNGDFTRDQFLQGKIAIFQSGTYNLANVADGAKFTWGITPISTGPAGQVSVTNGIVAAANAHPKSDDATKKVLKWMGSTEGNKYIGESGSAIPGVLAAQASYNDYWKSKNVDVSPFFDVVAKGKKTIPAPIGAKYADAAQAFQPILDNVFLGKTPVADGMKEADKAANDAIK